MAIMDKTVRGLGKITGTTIKVIKNAPKKTIDKSKDLKDAFVEGLQSDEANEKPELPKI